ncbi:hypothetical protein NMY22_g15663 [Coprinellus aureogranulatus]|nr:hypothetical protein NMY22_g15663 [Coprinellus aureogranulatus]
MTRDGIPSPLTTTTLHIPQSTTFAANAAIGGANVSALAHSLTLPSTSLTVTSAHPHLLRCPSSALTTMSSPSLPSPNSIPIGPHLPLPRPLPTLRTSTAHVPSPFGAHHSQSLSQDILSLPNQHGGYTLRHSACQVRAPCLLLCTPCVDVPSRSLSLLLSPYALHLILRYSLYSLATVIDIVSTFSPLITVAEIGSSSNSRRHPRKSACRAIELASPNPS